MQSFVFAAFVCCLLTISGHDAQGHEGIASNQLVVVCDEYAQRIQSPKAQQRNLVLISWQQRESANWKIKYGSNAKVVYDERLNVMKGVGIKNSSVKLLTESVLYVIKPWGDPLPPQKREKRCISVCISISHWEFKSPLSAKVWIASQALTRMSSSGELSSSTAVAGVLLSTARGSNCWCKKQESDPLRLCFTLGRTKRPSMIESEEIHIVCISPHLSSEPLPLSSLSWPFCEEELKHDHHSRPVWPGVMSWMKPI